MLCHYKLLRPKWYCSQITGSWWGEKKTWKGQFLFRRVNHNIEEKISCEKATSARVQVCLPSVFGEWLTAICGKSNKNGEQRFSLLFFFFFKGCLFKESMCGSRKGESNGSCERRGTQWNKYQQFKWLLWMQGSE